MMYWISVGIYYRIDKMRFDEDGFTFEIFNKKRTHTLVRFVVRLGVTAKQVCKLFRQEFFDFNFVINFSKVWNFGKVSWFGKVS